MADPRWWLGRGTDRHAHDVEIVRAEQPELVFGELEGILTLAGPVIVITRSGVRHRIETLIAFPEDYPAREPVAVETGGRFTHDLDHHFYSSGRCCLWLPAATLWNPRDPDALRIFLEQLVLFYHRQLIMETDPTAPYPGPAWAHGDEGFLEYLEGELDVSRDLLRRLRLGLVGKLNPKGGCPCGSGKQFRRCHQPPIDRFRGRVGRDVPERLAQLLAAPPRTAGERAPPASILDRGYDEIRDN